MDKIPVRSAKIYTRDGSDYRTVALYEEEGSLLSLVLYREEICLEVIAWKNAVGFSGSGKIKLRIRPDKYGLGSKRGVFDKDIIGFRMNGEKRIGEVSFDLAATIRGENAWEVILDSGEVIPLSRVRHFKVLGTSMDGTTISDFAGDEHASGLLEEKNRAEIESEPSGTHPDAAGGQLSMDLPEAQSGPALSENAARGDELVFYTDGSAIGNPGPCGGAYIMLRNGDVEKEKKIPLGNGTNNIAEMMAVIRAMEEAERYSPARVIIRSDSQYVVKGITEWSNEWEKNGWRRPGGGEVKNADLWKHMKELSRKIPVEFEWVKGHANNEYNDRADVLAVEAAKLQRAC